MLEDIRSYMKRSDDYDQFKLGNRLEERINRLENILKTNEGFNRDELGLKAMNAVESVSKASDIISQIVISLDYENDPLMGEWKSIEDKLNDIIVKINKLGFKL